MAKQDKAVRAALETWLFPRGLNHPEHWSLTNEGAREIARAALAEKGPSTISNLDEMERLLEAATPGPWTIDRPVAGGWKIQGDNDTGWGAAIADSQNAALIVAAVNSLPALIAAARRAKALEKALDEILATVYSPDIDTYTDKSYSALHLKAIRIAQQARATLTGEGAPR